MCYEISAATSIQHFIYWLRKVLQAIKKKSKYYIKTNDTGFGQQGAGQTDRSSGLKCVPESAGRSVHEL